MIFFLLELNCLITVMKIFLEMLQAAAAAVVVVAVVDTLNRFHQTIFKQGKIFKIFNFFKS